MIQHATQKMELVVTDAVCDAIIDFLRRDILPDHHVTACVETVDVVRIGHFAPIEEVLAIGSHHKHTIASPLPQTDGVNRDCTSRREAETASR